MGGQFGGFLQPELLEGWQLLDKANIKPALNAKSLSVQITQNQSSSAREPDWLESIIKWARELVGLEFEMPSAYAYWDNVLVIPTHIRQPVAVDSIEKLALRYEIGENILENPEFEKDGEGWRLSSRAQWVSGVGSSGGAVRTSLASEGSSLGSGVFDQCVTLDGHKQYKMGVRFKQDEQSTQSGGGRFRLTWYNEVGCRGNYKTDSHHADIKPINGWQDLVVDNLIRPDEARSAKVTMIQSVQGEGEYAGYWDGAYFTAVAKGR